MASGGGSRRIADLFEQKQGVPISRSVIQSVGNQLDYMKRVRRNGGARDLLDKKGIALLWGKGDSLPISKLGLGKVGADEFVSYTPKNKAELELLRKNGHADLHAPKFK